MVRRYKNVIKHALITAVLAFGFMAGSAVPVLAADYNCGAYGVSTYGNNTCAQSGGGSLADTGQPLKYIIPAVLIIAGVLLLFYTQKKMKTRHQSPTLPTDLTNH